MEPVARSESRGSDAGTPTHQPQSQHYALLLVVLVALMIGFSVLPVRNVIWGHTLGGKDYPTWFAAGRAVLDGQALYPSGQPWPYIYPPFTAIVVYAPLSALGPAALVITLLVINSVAWLAAILLTVYLVTGRLRGQNIWLYLLPAAGTVPYVWDTYFLGQPNILLLSLMLAAFVGLERGRPWLAGAMIGLAIAIKAFPLLALPYLVYRRMGRPAAATVSFAAIWLLIVPAPLRGFQQNLRDLMTWTDGMILQQSVTATAQRPEGYGYRNQSLQAVVHRLTSAVDAGEKSVFSRTRPSAAGSSERYFRVNFLNLSPQASHLLYAVAIGCLCLYYAWCMPPHAQRTAETDQAEYAMLLCLIVLFSPLAWTYFYCWMLLPLAVLLRFIQQQPIGSRRRRVAGMLAGLIILVLASALSQLADQTLQALGVTAWGCVLLFLTLGWILRETRPAEASMSGSLARSLR